MQKVFTFGFNIVMDQAKYFFPNHGLHFNQFNSSKLMDKIKADINGIAIDQTKRVANQNFEMNAN